MPPKAPPKKKLSTLKRARQAEQHNLQNRSERSRLKTFAKEVLAAVSASDKDKLVAALKKAIKAYSSAGSKGVIHKNTASRKISRLTKLANSVLSPKAA